MAEKYYKVAESDLVAIADAIRLQKGSENKYQLKDFAKIIGAMLVLPSGLAETEISIAVDVESNVIGILPTVYKGNASTNVKNSISISSSAIGILIE